MKLFRHWTPRYVANRIRDIYYRRTCPEDPWLTKAANAILSSYLGRSDAGLELGSGRSTVWLAKRIRHLISLEHNEVWYHKVRRMLKDNALDNVDLHLIPAEEQKDGKPRYVAFVDGLPLNSIDFALVDGAHRGLCALSALERIRPGGLLIIDNANWYFPCQSRSPYSRTRSRGFKGEVWKQVWESIADWRRIWTSSGVADTALFFKPFDAGAAGCDQQFRNTGY